MPHAVARVHSSTARGRRTIVVSVHPFMKRILESRWPGGSKPESGRAGRSRQRSASASTSDWRNARAWLETSTTRFFRRSRGARWSPMMPWTPPPMPSGCVGPWSSWPRGWREPCKKGRAALNSLRTSTTEGNDLMEALKRATESEVIPSFMAATCSVVGDSREMHPIVRDEVYRIGYEAILNACLHSRGRRLRVELEDAQNLVLRVSDNDVCIDPGRERGRSH